MAERLEAHRQQVQRFGARQVERLAASFDTVVSRIVREQQEAVVRPASQTPGNQTGSSPSADAP